MDSKAHLLLFLSTLLLFHPHLTSSTCVKRDYLHIIHSLLLPTPSPSPDPSISPQQSSNPPQVSEQPAADADAGAVSPSTLDPTSIDDTVSSTIDSASSSIAASLGSDTPDPNLTSTGNEVQESAGAVSASASAAIKGICAKTDYADDCVSSLTGMPIETDSLDLSTALQMLIKSAIRHGNAALNNAKKLAGDTSLPDFTLQNMKVCEDTYSSALDNFQKATEAAAAKDMGTLNSMLSAAMTDYETCSDGFMEMPGASPLMDYDTKLSHMTSNCLAVASLLK